MSAVVESPQTNTPRDEVLVENSSIYVRRGSRVYPAVLSSVNFTPVIALQRNHRVQVFPISQLPAGEQEKLHDFKREKIEKQRVERSKYIAH